MDTTTWLTSTELLDCVHHQATERQLERWRKNDLIPRPRRHSLGRGRGFRSVYPPCTCEQLVALLELHRTERRLNRLRFALWWRGFPIPPAAIKKTLEKLAFGSVRQLRKEIRGKSPAEAAADAATWAMPDMLHSPMGRIVRRLLGSEAAMQHLLAAMIQLGLGSGPIFARPGTPNMSGQQPVAELLMQAMGLDVARTVGIGDAGPWLTGDAAEVLAQLEPQAAFSFDRMQQALQEASLETLERARHDAAIFIPGFVSMAQALHVTGSPEVFGWVFRFADIHNPVLQAQTTIELLVARQELGDMVVDTLNATLSAQQPLMAVAIGITEAMPALTTYVNLNTGLQALNDLDPAAREAVQQQVSALLGSHPQWAAALTEWAFSPNTTEPEPEEG